MNTSIKKFISCVAAIACLCVNASAQTKITSSNYSNFGILDEDYSQYIGYYAITSSADLKGFANLVNGGSNTINGVVTTNINVAVTDFTPIGTSTYPFRGKFERYSGTIQISASSETNTTSRSYQGLFGYNSGTIKSVQLALDKVTIYGTQYVGGIAGYNTGTITGCSVKLKNNSTGGIKGTSTTTYAGGIAGYNTGTIGDATKCTNNVSVIGVSVVGGIVGYNSGTVWGQNNGDVTGTGSSYVGGIVANNVGTVKSSTNNGNVTGAGYYVGGICGENNGASTIIDGCTNNGTIVSSSYKVGGICGQNYRGTIKTSAKNTGPVKGSYYVGGVCGYNSGSLTRGTSAANILIEATAANSYVGGICGYNYGKMVAATRQSSNSNVKGVTYVGGVVGYNASDTVELFSAANTDATVTSTASSGYSYCGGVAGYNAGTLTTVYNAATVTGAANCVGGIAGYNSESGVIASSITNYANVTGSQYVGGICGNNFGKIYDGTVRYYSSSYPLPVITATATGKAYVGGISGNNSGTIRLSNPSATISGSMVVGGVAGQNSGTIFRSSPDSWNYSGFSVTATTTSDTARCGGVCGVNLATGIIDTCGYYGAVTGNRYVGGVCGDNAGTIRNGSYSGTFSSSSGYAGGVCGNNTGTITNNCVAAGDLTINGARSGGVCGNNTGTISNCVAGKTYYSDYYDTFSFNAQYTGGVCGYNTGTISNCTTGYCIINSSASYSYCAAICGYNASGCTISNCTITNSTVAAYGYVGGVCGKNEGTVSNSSVTKVKVGKITLKGTSYGYAGGVVGWNGGTVSYCYSDVDVEQTGSCSTAYVGGLVGYNVSGSNIEYSYSQSNVTAQGRYVGGLVGYNAASISNTYAYGSVKSSSYYVGGLIGYRSSGTITNSYYLADAATDGNNKVQNGCGASSLGSTVSDVSGVNKKSFISFSDGEVCYLLNGSVNGGSPWGQSLGSEVAPSLRTDFLVYKISKSGITTYRNSPEYEVPASVIEKLANFDGDGSQENPFLIPDLQHLEDFRDIVAAGFYRACGKLTADIVVNESVLDENGDLRSDYRSAQLKTWVPIKDFMGCFDGDNHIIKGLFCLDVEGEKALFSSVQGAEIKNLTVADGYIKTSINAAGICTKATNSRISNCHNTCVILTDGGFPFAGGICGWMVKSTVEKCSNSGSVICTENGAYYVGGIVGQAESGCVIRDSYNTGEVAGGYGYGGICGVSQGKTLIERCYNTGLIRSTGNTSSDMGAGILGSMAANDVIRNCFNTGTIIGVKVGGIVSGAGGTVEYCYNAGTINGTTKGCIAGVKTSDAIITYNYYDKTVETSAGGINGTEIANQAVGKTTTVLCNSTLSTALNSYYNTAIWQAGTTANASDDIITEDSVFGYKIVGTYPSLKGVGEPQYAKTLWVNIGTAANPNWISNFIPIYTIEQLKAVSNNLSATYVLMNNVAETKNIKNGELVSNPSISWTPIANFRGNFYGLGHTISGLYAESSDQYVGLFGFVNGGKINGVKIANSKFVSTNANGYAGGIAGNLSSGYYDGVLYSGKISDCDNLSCTVESKNESGGIVGYAGDDVEYCRNYAKVSSTGYAGGICGMQGFSTIRCCYNEGTITGTGANVGGIGGSLMSVYNCYNIGTLSGGNVGGIAGSDGLGTEVRFSYSAGTLSGSGSVGNILGSVGLGGSTTKCYYDSKNSEYDGVSGSMDREGKVESKTTDELCLELLDGLSSDYWAIKEPEIKYGKKYLYYPYLKHFGEQSATVGTYRAICKVTLNPNGGTCTELTEYIEREGAELPQDVVRDGYTFGGWYSNASCTSEEVTEIPVTATGEQTFYAKWTANSYSITLNTNGGTINSGNVTTYTYGNTVMLPTDVTRTGYTFGGWYTSSSLSGSPVTSITATNYGNKYFYAKWNVNSYNITYVTNNGTINDDEYAESYNFGVAKTLPTNVTKTGYTFAGWYTNDSYSGDAVSAVSTTDFGDKTFYAKWNVNSYDITLDTDGGIINSGNITSYTYGVGATLPTDITKTGYKFEGWYDDSSDEPVLAILSTETGDRSFSAQWAKVPYIITLNANEGTISDNGNDKINYNYGDEVTLPVPTREGYTFGGWYNNSNLVGTEFTKVASTETGNKEFWARWEVNTYFVTLNVDGGEINSGNVASYTYNVLTILPQDVTKVGHTFDGWFDSENQKVTQISKGTIGDVTFTAKWTAKTYNVTLQTNNGTINGETITSYTYGIGATLPTNITKTGYDFQGWYDNSSYDGGEVTEIASNEVGDRNFWAKWTAGTYDVTLDVDGGTVNSNAIERYTYGVGAVLPTDVTKIGFTFKGWKDEDDNFALEITTADYGDKTFTAQWEQANYDITYNANGGLINESYEATYNYGNEITLPTDVTKDGCAFLGWYDNSNFTGEAVEAISATEYGNKTFYAKWLANSYNVILVTNEGTINSGNIEGYTYGVTAILPTDVTKDGYTFTGWYSDENCEGDVVSIISSTETGNKTFYAGWSNTAYSVTLHTNDGIISSGNVTAYTFGTEVQLPSEEQISKTGYTFCGWYDNASCSGETISSIASTAIGAKQYWAKWSVNTYNVAFVTNEGTIHSGNVKSYIYGTTVVLPSDVTKMGYTFDGWYDNESCSGSSILSISSTDLGDKTFYANWIVNSYYVTLVTNDGTINSGNIENYTYGEEATLPTNVTKNGYTFDGWFTNTSYLGSSVSSILPTETGDKTFYAKWSIIAYNVTLNINGGTINSGAITAYNYGNTVILPTDVAKTGSKFEGWYDNADFDGEAVQSIMPTETGDKEFFAKWSEIEYAITLNVNGGAISGDYATSYKYGMAVELPSEVTKEGCTFEGWYTNSNGDGLAVSAIESDAIGTKVFWAIWTVNKFKVTADHDNAMGSVEGAGTYNYNRQATLTAKSDAGYEFTGWSTESTLDGVSLQDSTIQFFVYDNIALTANFKKKEIIYAINNLIIDTLKTGVQNEPINIRDLFKSSENGEVYFSAVSTNPSLVVADVVDGKLYLTTNQFKGVAEVTVTAKLANGNKASLTAEVVVEYDCDITIADVAITNVSCYGLADGKIELTAVEDAEYTYQWVNSESTANVLENVPAGNYQVVITDEHLCEITKTYTVSQPAEIIATINEVVKPKCNGTDGAITVSASGNYEYLWSNNTTEKDLANAGIGDYTLKVTDPANGCFITLGQTLEYPANPVITVESVEKTRCDQQAGAVIVSVDNEVSYQWTAAGETISTDQNLTNVAAGIYTLTVTDENNCSSSETVEVKNFEVQVPQISLVTVSRQTGKNLIVWVRENTDLIDYYTIYRESANGEYDSIGTVNYTEISVFEDDEETVDPMNRAWSYKITATDICGNETEMSEAHTTLHLGQSPSLRKGYAELDWQPYVGVDYRSFYIVRETTVGSYTFIDTVSTVPASKTTYTAEIPTVGKTLFYVGIKLNEVIDPKDFMKAESGPFALALSNIAEAENNEEPEAIETIGNNAEVYAIGHTIYVNNAEGAEAIVYDIKGQKIATAKEQDNYEFSIRIDGIYLVKVGGASFKVMVK